MTDTFETTTGVAAAAARGEYAGGTVDLLADADVDAGFGQPPVRLSIAVSGVHGLPEFAVEWAWRRWLSHYSGLSRASGRAPAPAYRASSDRGDLTAPHHDAVIEATCLIDATGGVLELAIAVTTNDLDEVWISGAADVIRRLAHDRLGNRESAVALGDARAVVAQYLREAQSPDLLERDHWAEFATELEELEPATIGSDPAGDTGAAHPDCRRLRINTPEADSGLSARVAVVGSVLRALADSGVFDGDTADGVLIDVEEPARTQRWALIPGRIRRRFPLLIPDEFVATDIDTASPDQYLERLAAIVDIDGRTAGDHGALRFTNPLSEGMFDDLAEADVLVAIRSGDAMPASEGHEGGQTVFGRYAVVVTVWIGATPVDGQQPVVVDVAVRPGARLHADALATSVAAALGAWGAGHPGDVAGVGAAFAADPAAAALVSVDDDTRARIEGLFGTTRDVLPVSALQEGLLFHLQSAQASQAGDLYASQFHLTIDGQVDAARMREAVRALLLRYPNLAAGFVTIGDRTLSVVPSTIDVPFADLRREAWERDFDTVAQVFEHERAQPFSATAPPLIRFVLIEIAPGSSVLCVTFEHILADGWSAGLMMDTLLDLYTDPSGRSLTEVVSFRTYLQWLAGRDLNGAREIWARQLSGFDEPTLLRPDAAASAATTGMARDHHEDLSRMLSDDIRAAAAATGVTVSTFLQAAWGITLSRLVGRDDVVFGTTVSGRPADLEGAESIVGLLFNTVPVRMTLSPDQTVAQVLGDLHTRNMDVLEHPYIGLGDMQAMAGLRTLFDTLFIIQNHPGRREGQTYGPDGEMRIADAALTDSTHYPVSFALYPGEQIHVRCAYRGDLLGAEEVGVLVDRLRGVLQDMAADTASSVGGIAVAADGEHALVTSEWNATTREIESITVAELFDAAVTRTPEEVALRSGRMRLTFAELGTQVNQYARGLRQRGVAPESRVILMLPRDERMIISMFASFAVGAAYVPVDADHPADRIGYMIAAAAPTLIVTTIALAARLGPVDCPVLDLDDVDVIAELGASAPGPLSAEELGTPVHLDNLAYIIFTSGSTGRPKGVAVPYRGLTNMYFNHAERIFDRVVAGQGGRRMRIAHTTSFSFDASWEQLFWLLAGHEVHVIDEDMRRDPTALLAYYDREVIDGFDVTPSYAMYLIEQGLLERDRPRGLSVSETAAGVVFVSLGGEAVPDVLWTALRDAPGVEGYNLYGPTEYTINALGADVADSTVSSVGNPIFNTRAHILDSGLNPALPGVAGELYLAGAGTARGYFGQPSMTGHRFVACPWGDGERMYRTGDLARWRADGSIEYLGRVDDQVKIRGYRIELGEIVNVLLDAPPVAQATVVVRDGAAGPILVAYVVAAEGEQQIDTDVLRAHVAQRLPDYMIPSAFGVIAEIPLTINGKVDTRALPAVDTGEDVHLAPRTPTEEVVAEVIASILGLDRVSVDDDFFALGGHSLLAMRVVSRVNAALDSSMSLRDVFDNPSVAGIAAVVDSDGAGLGRLRVCEVARTDVVPASFGQQALWLIGQVTGAGSVYTIPVLLSVGPDFDQSVWAAALADVVTRQEALRTLLVDVGDGVLQQQLVPVADLDSWLVIETIDVTGGAESDVPQRVQSWVREPMDVGRDFPVRAAVFRTGDTTVVAALAIHHAFMDEWSLPVLLRDLGVAHAARRMGQDPAWEPLAVSYGQYASWQRALLGDGEVAGSVAAQQLGYWAAHLADAPDVSMVATDRPRPALASHDGFSVEFSVDDAVTQGLRALAASSDISMYMLVQAAVAVTMSSFGAGDDVVLGSPVGGRGDEDLDDLVGYFVNTLPMRHRLDGNPALAEVLDRVREVVLGGFANQDVPFDQIVQYSGVTRSSAHNPLFQTLVTYRVAGVIGSSADSLAAAGFGPYAERVEIGTVKSDLDIDIADGIDGLSGVIACAAALFDESTGRRLADGLVRVLAAFAGDLTRRLSDLSVLGSCDLGQIDRWSQGQAAASEPGATLDVLMAEMIRTAPDAIAVRGGQEALSYQEFGRATTRLAHRLIADGLEPEGRVAVFVPRSIDMVTAFVAVLVAGGTVVPVDSSYPVERIRMILDDCRPATVLTTSASARAISEITDRIGARVICLDELGRSSPEAAGLDHRLASLRSSNAAYVIYTSGSTGRPKGVVVDHAAIINLIRWRQSEFPLAVGESVLQKTSVGFDPAIPEILWPLVVGGTVVLADDGGDKDLTYLGSELNSGDITFVELVPSVIAAMIEQDIDLSGSGLKYLSAGGEALSGALRERIAQAWGVPVWNTYGPAEATVEVTSFAGDTDSRGAIPIGAPVWNTHVLVLDDLLRPVAPGVTGELYVGGVQLARGYLDRPDLTAGRFVASPTRDGERLYRTGDLVRWTGTGDLVFVGRADNQVKINGSRVELGDVEAALGSIADVANCAVTVSAIPGGACRLIAYVTPAGSRTAGDLDPSAIRTALFDRVPAHMVPSAVIPVATLPRTANGKLDHSALPAPEDSAGTGRLPETPTEQMIASAFADVLDVDRVSADDDFFGLGGHSLLAMRVVSRINAALGSALSLRDVFDRPSVAGLACVADSATSTSRIRLADVVCGEVVPASFGQEALWLIGQVTGAGSVYTIPVVLTVGPDFDQNAWAAALTDVLIRQEALRTLLVDSGEGVLVQRVVPAADLGSCFGIEQIYLAGSAQSAGGVHARIESWVQRPVDVGSDFPVRAAVFTDVDGTSGDRATIVALAIHHVAVDEWSLPVLLRDLGSAYSARREGRAPVWERPVVPYGRYAVWQRELLGDFGKPGSVGHGQLGHWRAHLAGVPEVSMVATDRPRPVVAEFDGFSLEFDVDDTVTQGLRDLCASSDVSMYMVVQAAVAVMMFGFGAGDDVVLGSPVGGRGDEDLDNIVGYFVNTLPLRHRLDGNPTLATVLTRVREVVLSGFANQDVPFGQIVQDSGVARSSAHNPLFQTIVTYRVAGVLDSSVEALLAEGFSPLGQRVGIGAVKSDLEVDIGEHGEHLVGTISCASSLFDEVTAHRLADGMREVLAAFAGDVDRRLSDVAVVGSAESARIDAWSRGETVPVDQDVTVDLLLAEAARTHAAVPAVRGGPKQLSYAEFDGAVNRLARYLLDLGVTPEARVAVLLQRSVKLPSVLSGIVRAGGTFVPIDPANPADRIEYVLTQSGSTIIIVEPATRSALEGVVIGDEVTVIDLGSSQVQVALAQFRSAPIDDGERVRGIRGSDAAYVIYTSGSTGRPKGVVIEHHGFVNFLRWKQQVTGIEADERVLQKTPISFDASLWEFFVPLMIGATVVMADPDGHRDPAYLARIIADEQLTTIEFVPSMLDALLEYGVDDVDMSSLRRIFCGGEALSVATASAALARFGDILFNLYGPTETTVGITSQKVSSALLDSGARFGGGLPIGVPAHNSQAWVLDRYLSPVPVGVVGELYLGGPQLARGYHGRTDLTATAFVASPMPGAAGERMYRTGDLVRWNKFGSLEYLGRADDQIKIRGFRVEVDEIRTVLEQHPGIRSAAVVARDRTGVAGADRYLAAYYCAEPSGGPEFTAADPAAIERVLRAHLSARLPDYMVPSAYVRLDAIPVTVNGKLDVKALPEPGSSRESGTEPATGIEKTVAQVVQEILGLGSDQSLSLEDDFFSLGGHSLLAARLVTRLNRALGSSLTMQSVFSGPTIGALAQAVDPDRGQSPGGDPVLLRLAATAAGQQPVIGVHASSGFGTVYSTLTSHVSGGRGLVALQDPAHAGDPRDFDTLDELVDFYTGSVLACAPDGPYDLVGWSYGGHIAFGIARELEAMGKEVATVTILDTPPVTESSVIVWGDAEREHEVRTSFARFAELPDVTGFSRAEIQELNAASGGPLSTLGDREAFAFMDSFDRCLRLMEARPTVGALKARGVLVLGREHADSLNETSAQWQRHFHGELEVRYVDVGHEDMVSATGVPEWAPWWAQQLRRPRTSI